LIDTYQGLQAKLNYHQMQQDGLAIIGSGNDGPVGVGGKVVKDVLSSGMTMRLNHNKEEEAGSNRSKQDCWYLLVADISSSYERIQIYAYEMIHNILSVLWLLLPVFLL
jgi:hypothetical protein